MACTTPLFFETIGREITRKLHDVFQKVPKHYSNYKITLPEKDSQRVVKEFLALSEVQQHEIVQSIAEDKKTAPAKAIDITSGDDSRAAAFHPILNPNTTKHDKARYIEMFADQSLVALWTEAYSPFDDRATLDDKY